MFQALKENKTIHWCMSYVGLFTSFGTLICCALPATLVLLGMGASVAAFLSEYPQLIFLSENKKWVFGISFVMLTVSYAAQRLSLRMACPIEKKEDCKAVKKSAGPLFIITLMINIIGTFYAFILPRLL